MIHRFGKYTFWPFCYCVSDCVNKTLWNGEEIRRVICYVVKTITKNRSNQSKQQIRLTFVDFGTQISLNLDIFWFALPYLKCGHCREKKKIIWPNSIRDWNPFPRTVERIRRKRRKKKVLKQILTKRNSIHRHSVN